MKIEIYSSIDPLNAYQNIYESNIIEPSLKTFALTSGFFFGATVIRWLFRAYRKCEFDDYPPEQMIQICKFCQIIKD